MAEALAIAIDLRKEHGPEAVRVAQANLEVVGALYWEPARN